MPTILKPLSNEEAAYYGFTHYGVVTADDLTTATNGTAQTLKVGNIRQFAQILKAVLIIRKAFRNKSDPAFNNVTFSMGDQTNGATRFIAATQASAYANQVFNDGVLNGTTTVTSATAAFVAGDVGKRISGGSIPAGATIASVTNSTTVVISAAATGSATGVTLTLADRAPTPTTTPRASSSVSLAITPYAAADEIDLVVTPMAGKNVNNLNEGEAVIFVQKLNPGALMRGKGLTPIAK